MRGSLNFLICLYGLGIFCDTIYRILIGVSLEELFVFDETGEGFLRFVSLFLGLLCVLKCIEDRRIKKRIKNKKANK